MSVSLTCCWTKENGIWLFGFVCFGLTLWHCSAFMTSCSELFIAGLRLVSHLQASTFCVLLEREKNQDYKVELNNCEDSGSTKITECSVIYSLKKQSCFIWHIWEIQNKLGFFIPEIRYLKAPLDRIKMNKRGFPDSLW